MEKGIKNKVAKAVVPAIDVMFQALRFEGHTACAYNDLCGFVIIMYLCCLFCLL